MRSLLVVLTLATAVSADELTLRNGGTFTGVVREQGDKVTIESDYGSMTFKKIDVRSVVKGRSAVGDFDAKVSATTSTQGLAAVAAWALDNGLRGRAEGLFRSILAVEPDHAEARRGLGFENVDGRWLTGDDLQIARGLAKVDGRWIPKEEAAKLLELQVEADRLEAQRRLPPPPPSPPYQEVFTPAYCESAPVVFDYPTEPEPYYPQYVEPSPCLPSAPPYPASLSPVRPAPSPYRVYQTPPLNITPLPVRPMRITSR